MNKKILLITNIVGLTIVIAIIITIFVFNTSFARNAIDYFSFVAALFLIVDGFYKIGHYKNDPYFPNQLIRHVRIIIGTCVFTIHVLQYAYGV